VKVNLKVKINVKINLKVKLSLIWIEHHATKAAEGVNLCS
jgi:hypothetical protein